MLRYSISHIPIGDIVCFSFHYITMKNQTGYYLYLITGITLKKWNLSFSEGGGISSI